MMVADEIRALLLIHDRLNAWERPFIRDMAKLLEHRRSLTTKQLATIQRILDRHHAWAVPTQAVLTTHQISWCAGSLCDWRDPPCLGRLAGGWDCNRGDRDRG